MQDIIKEVEFLSNDLHNENTRMLKLIEQLMAPSTNQALQRQPIDKQSRQRSIRIQQKQSLIEESILNASRQSFETIKNPSIKRCESCESIKNSRQTEKTLSRNKKRVGEMRHESNMARLSKISQKMAPLVKGELLIKKKSKIFHFDTRY